MPLQDREDTFRRIDALFADGRDTEPFVHELLPEASSAGARANGARIFRVLSRVSDDKLLSIPLQVKECLRYAWGETISGAARPDPARPVVVDRVYNLGEQSGFSVSESPVYRRLLAEAAGGSWDGLVARDSSRLGRDYWEKMGTIRDLRAARVELHVLEDGGFFDYEDSVNKVKSFASTWADEGKKLEEIRKSLRATKSLRELGFPTASVPFGYVSMSDPLSRRRVWAIVPQEAEKVRAIFREMDEEPEQEKVSVARRHGVSKQLLRKILANRAYTGGYNWEGRFVRCDPRIVPPIVDEALFERVQARLSEAKENRKRAVATFQ